MANEPIRTPEGRVAFPYLFNPRPPLQADGKAKFSLTLVFDAGTDLSELKAAARKVAVEKWGDDPAKWPKNLKQPFHDGDEKDHLEGFEAGQTFITATSIQQPGLVGPDAQPGLAESDVYPGCYGRMTVGAFAYDMGVNKGVSFGLRNVQKTKDGTPIAGRTRAEDDFDAVAPVQGVEGGAAAAPLGPDDPFA